MIRFFKDFLPRISRYSRKLDEVTLLTNQHWVLIDKTRTSKVVFIFMSNSDLLISVNGKVEKGKWTYLGNDSLLIEKPDESYLYKHGFFDDTVLALKRDGTLDFAFFVNETKIGKELNDLDNILTYLDNRYIRFLHRSTYEDGIPVLTDELNPVVNDQSKWGYSSCSGTLLIPFEFDTAYRFVEGFAIVIISNRWGMIDKTGIFKIPPKYEFLEAFSEGLALARLNRKFGFIDKDDNVCIDFIYDDAESFESGRAKVKKNGETFLLPRNQ